MQPWIDFLPQEYHQRRRHLRQRWQQAALVVGVLLLAGVSVFWQQWRWHQLQDQLETARQHLALCQQQGLKLQASQQQLRRAEAKAALCCFLEHPWSRSRLLAFLLHALPEQVRLNQVDVHYLQQEQPLEGRSPRASRPTAENTRQEQARVHPAAEDLKQLQQEQHLRRLVLLVQGTAGDYEQIQRLLVRLRSIPALERLQLLEVETGEDGRLAFRIRGQFRLAFPAPAQQTESSSPQTGMIPLLPARR